MLYPSLAIILGIIVLVWSADRFVLGAAATARCLGAPALLIGMTVVGFGTSAPELFISGFSAWQGNPGLAIGNALGSNIANVALVLGITALLVPLKFASRTLAKEMPLMIGATLIAGVLLFDQYLGRIDGVILLSSLVLVMAWIVSQGGQNSNDPLAEEIESEQVGAELSLAWALFWVIVGLVLLVASSKLLVWAAVSIAQNLGVSDLVIGLTVVAIGTSLPELAATLTSAYKKEHDIAIGNVIGSNIFNIFGVLGLPGVIAPNIIPGDVMSRDFPVVLGLSLLLFAIAYRPSGSGQITRVHAGILLFCFFAYQAWLFLG